MSQVQSQHTSGPAARHHGPDSALTARRLRPGDRVGVATPSGPVDARHGARMRRGVDQLERMGFSVTVGEQGEPGGPAGGRSPEARADELNGFLSDPSIRAVFCSIGGYTANQLLPLLDYDTLRADPKPLVGYSDISALLLAAHRRAGVVTFHGPTLLPELGEFPDVHDYTRSHLLGALCQPVPAGRLEPPVEWTEERLEWGVEDDRPRRMRRNAPWRWLRPGEGRGALVGGNVDTINFLVGTDYLPDLDGRILFWETLLPASAAVERALAHLRLCGALAAPAGMVVGKPLRMAPGERAALDRAILDAVEGSSFPVLVDVDLGHTDPQLTLPLGVEARLDAGGFELLEPAVR